MTLYVNRKTILVMLYIYVCVSNYCECNASDTTDSDEDDKLREALLLVDILKSEYSRVVQENDILRAGREKIIDLSTCPTTEATNDNALSPNRTTAIPPLQATSHTNDHPEVPFYSRNRRNYRRYPPRYFRRVMKMPMDYYYYDNKPKTDIILLVDAPNVEKYRRFSYEDPFGAHPNDTTNQASMTSATSATASSITGSSKQTEAKLTTTTATSTLPMSTMSPSRGSTNINHKSTTSAKSSEEIQRLHLMLTIPYDEPEVSSTVDPVMSQVASELINEFKPERASVQPKNLKVIKFTKPTLSLGVTESWRRRSKLARTTYRVHLSGSTKLPIPYPENHAFCYTNPENPLCRTLIK